MTRDDGQVARLPLWIQDQSSAPFTVPDTLEDAPLYDGWGRLTGWTQQKNGTPIASYAYSFDQFGNLSTPTGAEVYGASTDRLLQRTDPATGHRWRYFYDRAGSLVSARDSTPGGAAVVWSYAYDGLGQLTTVSRSGRGAAGARLRHWLIYAIGV